MAGIFEHDDECSVFNIDAKFSFEIRDYMLFKKEIQCW
jgi:hypothetical protein